MDNPYPYGTLCKPRLGARAASAALPRCSPEASSGMGEGRGGSGPARDPAIARVPAGTLQAEYTPSFSSFFARGAERSCAFFTAIRAEPPPPGPSAVPAAATAVAGPQEAELPAAVARVRGEPCWGAGGSVGEPAPPVSAMPPRVSPAAARVPAGARGGAQTLPPRHPGRRPEPSPPAPRSAAGDRRPPSRPGQLGR